MKKDSYTFPAIIGKEHKEKEYSVYFPDLEVATSGISESDALNSARELLGTVLYGLELDKEKIPQPTKLVDIKINKNEYTILVDVYMPSVRLSEKNKSINRTVTLPAWLNAKAMEKHFNFSQVLQDALKEKLNEVACL